VKLDFINVCLGLMFLIIFSFHLFPSSLLCNWHAWYAFETREGTDMFQVPPTFLFNAPTVDDRYY